MKSQTVIAQFVFFFVIGLVLLTGLTAFFKFESDIIRRDLALSSIEAISSYISNGGVVLFDTCRKCTNGSFSFALPTSSEAYITLSLENRRSTVCYQPYGCVESSMHNLNATISTSGSATTGKTITLEKDKNNLRMR